MVRINDRKKRKKQSKFSLIITFIVLPALVFYLISYDYGSVLGFFSKEVNQGKTHWSWNVKNDRKDYWNFWLVDKVIEKKFGQSRKSQDSFVSLDSDGYDPLRAREASLETILRIEKIGANAPVIWTNTQDEDVILEDLRRGVSHYYQSAAPGQVGNMIITGHSSNYVWEKGDYNHIFRKLNNLENGDVISVHMKQKNGRNLLFNYEVSRKYVTVADDQTIFEDSKKPIMTLITCWPLGTDFRRLIVKAELIEK
jgi:LPXTG-site transpeptidase (sortase) family protein